jgi:8-oxo-dGTP diphosphatase
VLLTKRSIEPYKGKWDLPAGFIHFGEHPEETAIREAKEETGLSVKIKSLIDIVQAEEDKRAPGHFFFAYLAEPVKGRVIPGNEQSETGWFNLNNLPPLAWKIHAQVLTKVKRVITNSED